jgi:hypothetical protein
VCLFGAAPPGCDRDLTGTDPETAVPQLQKFMHKIPEDLLISGYLVVAGDEQKSAYWHMPLHNEGYKGVVFARPTQYTLLMPFLGTGENSELTSLFCVARSSQWKYDTFTSMNTAVRENRVVAGNCSISFAENTA